MSAQESVVALERTVGVKVLQQARSSGRSMGRKSFSQAETNKGTQLAKMPGDTYLGSTLFRCDDAGA
jgi:hypothetical protein